MLKTVDFGALMIKHKTMWLAWKDSIMLENTISLAKPQHNLISVYVLCPYSCVVAMSFCVGVVECYAVLHLLRGGDGRRHGGCSLSEQGEC